MAATTKAKVEIQTKMTGVEQVSAQFRKITGPMEQMGKALKTGFGVEAWRLATQAVWGTVNAIRSAISAGIEFNAMIETSQISMAAVLRSTLPDRFRTFNSALAESAGLFEQIRKGAVDAGISIAAASEVFAATSGMMTKSNVPLEKQAQLMTLIMRATKTMGLTSQIQLFQEARAMFMGENLRGALVAQASGMSISGLKQASADGTLDKYIEEKLGGFLESSDDLSKSFGVLSEKVKISASELAAAFTGPYMYDLKMAMAGLTGIMEGSTPIARLISGASRNFSITPFGKIWKTASDISSESLPGTIDTGIKGKIKRGMSAKGSRGWYVSELMKRGWSESDAYREFDQFAWSRDRKVNDWGMWADSDPTGETDDAMKSWLESVFAQEKENRQLFAKLFSPSVSGAMSPKSSGMASRGLYGSEGVAKYYQDSLDVQKSMLAQLKDVAKSTRKLVTDL